MIVEKETAVFIKKEERRTQIVMSFSATLFFAWILSNCI